MRDKVSEYECYLKGSQGLSDETFFLVSYTDFPFSLRIFRKFLNLNLN